MNNTRDQVSPGVSGRMSAAEALSRILSGTGLTYRWRLPRSIVIEPVPLADDDAVQLGPVRVQGGGTGAANFSPSQATIGTLPPAYAGGQIGRGGSSGLLGNVDMMDTPFAITSFTQDFMADIQAQNIRDIMRFDASVVFQHPTGSEQTDFLIRGFDVSTTDFRVDGLKGMAGRFNVETDAYERLEIFKGPAAMLNGGIGNLGGTVNLAYKRAADEPITRFTGRFTSDSIIGGNMDVGRRFGPDNAFGIRTNFTYSKGNSEPDFERLKSLLASVALDYRGERLRLTFDAVYSESEDDGAQQLNFGRDPTLRYVPNPRNVRAGVNRPIDGPFSFRHYDDSLTLSGRAEFDINSKLTAYAAQGYTRSRSRAAFPFLDSVDPVSGVEPTSSRQGVVASRRLRARRASGLNSTPVVFCINCRSVIQERRPLPIMA